MPDQPIKIESERKLLDAELKALAMRLYKNEIFTSLQIREHDNYLMGNIFMPLFLMGDANKLPDDVGMLYAEYKDAGPMGINGYPIFHSLSYLSRADTDFFVKSYNEIKAQMDEFLVPDSVKKESEIL